LPIHHAVLALLAGRTSYGYELRSKFERAVGPQWGDLNIGQVYQVLDRLERDGFVTKRTVEQTDRPAKYVFRLSKAGREELESWLDTPFVRQGGYRDDLFLKLSAASWLGSDRIRSVARVQREAYLAELAALGKLRRQHRDEPLVDLLIEAAILHTKANLRIVELAENKAARLAETEGAAVEDEPGDAAAATGTG